MSSLPILLRHIPPLFIALALTLGGLIPFISGSRALRLFGLPARIATSPPAQAVMILSSARGQVIGLAILGFWWAGDWRAVDQLMMITGAWLGGVDTWVVWKEGGGWAKAVGERALPSALVALYGLWGLKGGLN